MVINLFLSISQDSIFFVNTCTCIYQDSIFFTFWTTKIPELYKKKESYQILTVFMVYLFRIQ